MLSLDVMEPEDLVQKLNNEEGMRCCILEIFHVENDSEKNCVWDEEAKKLDVGIHLESLGRMDQIRYICVETTGQ